MLLLLIHPNPAAAADTLAARVRWSIHTRLSAEEAARREQLELLHLCMKLRHEPDACS